MLRNASGQASGRLWPRRFSEKQASCMDWAAGASLVGRCQPRLVNQHSRLSSPFSNIINTVI